MKSFLKGFRVLVVLLFFFIFADVGGVYSSEIFLEDFTNSNYSSDSRWYVSTRGGEVSIYDNWLRLTANETKRMPFVTFNFSDLLTSGRSLETKFRLRNNSVTYGGGIIFGSQPLVDNPYPSGDMKTRFTMGVWPNPNVTLRVISFLCSVTNQSCIGLQDLSLVNGTSMQEHVLRYKNNTNTLLTYVDDALVQETSSSDRNIGYLWLGNYENTNNDQVWPIIEIDYIKVFDDLVPSPTPMPLVPVVVVPGFGASWNYQEIFSPLVSDSWHIPSFVTLYDNLINSLVNAGYEKDVNLFVFPYDWRKGIDSLSDDLANFINQKLAGEDKINLIGHSYGGLVARGYAQKWGGAKINRLIEAGSPNYGLIDAYGAWEGGESWSNQWWLNTVFSTVVEFNRKTGESNVMATRRIVPALKDLLPTYDYLLNDGNLVDVASMANKNDELGLLNTSSSIVDSFTTNLSGTGQQTKEKINVVRPSTAESLVGKWQDGKPDPTNRFVRVTTGDDTVTEFSSKGNLTRQTLINTNHGGIISSSQAIAAVFTDLGLDTTKIMATTPTDNRSKSLVVALRSPGSLHVCSTSSVCDESLGIMPSNKIFIWPDYNPQDLSVRVEANGETGTYKLAVGEIEEEPKWKEVVGKLDSPTQINHYQVDTRTDEPSISQPDSEALTTMDQSITLLSLTMPNWDKDNLMAKIRDSSLSATLRLYAARQLRENLANLLVEKILQSDNSTATKIREVWSGLDLIVKGLTLQVTAINSNQLSYQETLVNKYRQFGESLLSATSSNNSANYFLESGEDLDNEAGAKLVDNDWAYEVLENSRLKLLVSLMVR